jgi:small subunit ribosomal protein S17
MVTQKKTKGLPNDLAAAKTKAPDTLGAAPAATNAQVDTRDAMQKRRTVVGTVVSNKMQKTIVVKVDRRVRHAEYKKYVVRSRRFKAHDEKNDAKIGDRVQLVESRPLSRDKRWVLQSIIRRAGQTQDVNV